MQQHLLLQQGFRLLQAHQHRALHLQTKHSMLLLCLVHPAHTAAVVPESSQQQPTLPAQ
jgi:hypothetical protein